MSADLDSARTTLTPLAPTSEPDRAPAGRGLLVAAWWVVLGACSALTLVWLVVGALVSTPMNEPTGQAVVDYLASGVALAVGGVLLVRGGRSWTTRLLVLAMVGTAGAFNLQAHAATLAVREATGIEIGELHQVLLHGVAGGAYVGALLLFASDPGEQRAGAGRTVLVTVVGSALFLAGMGTALLPHTVSCVVFFGFGVPLVGLLAVSRPLRHGATPEVRARARLLVGVLAAALGAATVLALLTLVLVLLGDPAPTLDDPTARHAGDPGGEPTALLFWFARLTAAVVALAVLAAHRARSAERWLQRGLSGLVVVVLLGGLFVLLAALVGAAGGPVVLGQVVAVLVVAAAASPVAVRVDRGVQRLLYGTRPTPSGVLLEVSELSRTAADADGLDQVPEAVGRRLGARRVRLTTHRPGLRDRTTEWRHPDGGAGDEEVAFPVRHGPEEVGVLAVDAEALAGGDDRVRLVSDVADSLGGVLAAHRTEIELERQLRAARAHADRIATARRGLVAEMDSERRALERNLHDGAQHHLVSLRLTLGLVEHLVRAGRPDAARAQLRQLRGQVDTAGAVLEETATGVSSASLARRGLVESLRADVAGSSPPITIDAAGLDGAHHDERVEAAVYFCCLESINNARKHAGGAPIAVVLREADGALHFTVRDEGPGFTPEPGTGPGRGLRNLTARVAALGGRVALHSAPGAGTTVEGSVPLPAPTSAASAGPSTGVGGPGGVGRAGGAAGGTDRTRTAASGTGAVGTGGVPHGGATGVPAPGAGGSDGPGPLSPAGWLAAAAAEVRAEDAEQAASERRIAAGAAAIRAEVDEAVARRRGAADARRRADEAAAGPGHGPTGSGAAAGPTAGTGHGPAAGTDHDRLTGIGHGSATGTGPGPGGRHAPDAEAGADDRLDAVVPELRPDPAPAVPTPPSATLPVLPPSGSPLFDAVHAAVARIAADLPPTHPLAPPVRELAVRVGRPWRIGVAGPTPADSGATGRVLAGLCPRECLLVDLAAVAARGPITPADVPDALVLLAEDDAGSRVPPWLRSVPTVEARVVPAVSVDGDDPWAGGAVRIALPGPGATGGRNLRRLAAMLVEGCRPRAARARARAALDELAARARRGHPDDTWVRHVLFEVERLRVAGRGELAEAEVAAALREGRLDLPADQRDAAERLTGRDGPQPWARLGLARDAEPGDLATAARAQRPTWQRLAAHPGSTRPVRDAAVVLVAACEALLAEAQAQAAPARATPTP